MARTKRPSGPEPSSSKRSKRAKTSKQKPTKKSFADQLQERRKAMAKRPIHPEKGLNMIALRKTFVPDIISSFGWVQVANQSAPYNEDVVREFYAQLVVEEFVAHGRVVVHGQEIIMTPEAINEYFGLQEDRDYVRGFPILREIQWTNDFASKLRSDGSGRWGRKQEIKQHELHIPAAFWNIFSSYSIQPTRHNSDVNAKRCKVVYCLMTGKRFSLGTTIHNEIAEASACTNKPGILPFPGLITSFCEHAGVTLDSRQTRAAKPPLGHFSYNAIVRKRPGVRQIRANGEFKEGDEETEQIGDGEREETMPASLDPSISRVRAPSPSEAGPSNWNQAGPSTPIPPRMPQQDTLLQSIVEVKNMLSTTIELVRQQQEALASTNERLGRIEQRLALPVHIDGVDQQHSPTERLDVTESVGQTPLDK